MPSNPVPIALRAGGETDLVAWRPSRQDQSFDIMLDLANCGQSDLDGKDGLCLPRTLSQNTDE
jgi:hypothetical protein